MPTPSSGAISMQDLRVEITRKTTSAVSLSELRERYGGSGAISIGDFYKSEGFVVTCAQYRTKALNMDGWYQPLGFGSVDPDEGGGRVSVAANSWIIGLATLNPGSTEAILYFANNSTGTGSASITTGFQPNNVTRIVTANVSRTLAASGGVTRDFTYTVPGSGSIHCLVKF